MFRSIPNVSGKNASRSSVFVRLRTVLLIAIVATSILLGHHFSRSVWAANIVWDNGGGADHNWSNPLNWSGDVVPGAGDVAVFDTSSGDATIDAGFAGSVGGIDIRAGYAGTVTHSSGTTLTVGGSGYTQAAGTFTGGTGNIDINGRLALAGGVFTASSNTTFVQSFNLGGTFNHNNGTFVLDGNIDVDTGTTGTVTLNNLTVDKSGFFTLFGSFIVNGTVNLNNGLFLFGGPIDAKGAVSILPTFNSGNGSLTISGPATRTITFAAGTSLPNTTLNAPAVTLATSGSGTLTWPSLTVQAGTLNQGGVNFVINGPYNQNGGTFNGGSNTIAISGAFTQTGGTFTGGSGDIDINGNFSLSTGTFTASGNTTFIAGRFSQSPPSGVFNHNGGTVVLDGNASFDNSFDGVIFNNLTLNKSGGATVFLDSTAVAAGTLTLADGFASNGTLEPRGAVVVGPGFDGGNGNLSFTGTANQTFTNNGGANPTGTWTVNKSSGKVTLASNLILNGGQLLNVTAGTLDQSASFNLQTSNALVIGATGTLRDFGTGDLTLGGNLINNGVFNFNGGGTNCSDPNVADQLLIRSSSSGTTRAWSGSGAFSVVDVDVQDQDATAISGGITAFGSSTVSNSPNWTANSSCPIIVSQPSNVSACPGSLVTFTVSSSDASATFQWRKNGVNLNNGGNISGANSATLTINPVSAADAASSPGYDAVGTNSFGVTATSNAATLTLLAPPLITSSPTNAIKCEGDSVTFTASATGDGLSFQWRKNTVNISGANSSSFTINPVAPGDAGSYDVVVTGTCAPPATSNAATLTVNLKPAITAQPTNQTACENGSASFTVAATGTNLTFQWRKNGTPLTNSGHFSGVNTATLTINPVGLSDADSYDVVVSGTCSPSVTSTARTLTVNTAPAISNQPTNQEVCEGSLASFSVGATGSAASNQKRSARLMRIEPLASSLTFQWRRNGSPLSNGGHISGADTPTLTINPSTAGDVGSYDVVVSGTCSPPATSNAASLTVDGFSLSASSQTVPLSGGSGSVNVITAAGCSWSAVSNDPFIHITSGSGGTGNGTVNFTVDSSATPRTGTMTIAGNTFTVNQSGGQVVAPVVISEFRFHGSAGPLDEFVELYNNSDAPADISGYALFTLTSGGSQTLTFTAPGALASSTTVIPARGHYLIANNSVNGYSLGAAATPDGTYTTDIVDGSGVALFAGATPASGTRADSVGFDTRDSLFFETSSLTPAGGITTDGEYSFVRQFMLASGASQDTGNNALDFVFVSTTGGTFNGRVSVLGAPGPENSSSPITRNTSFLISLIDPLVAAGSAPNRVRDLTTDPGNNSTFGTMTIRRRYTNNTASNITRLRFRIIDITTLHSPNVSGGAQQADIRARTSGDTTVTITGGGSVLLRGTTLESPPVQAAAGGSNSTLSAGIITLGAPLAPGATINIQWLLGVQQTGNFRFFVNVEALP